MQRLFALAASVLALAAVMVAPALAASPGTSGQPSQSCLSSTAPISGREVPPSIEPVFRRQSAALFFGVTCVSMAS